MTRFKRATGEGASDTFAALLLYPRLLLTTRPDVVLAALAALAAVALAGSDGAVARELRRRWLVPLACVAAQIVFLAYGNVRDGAPAHHAARALLGSIVITAAFAVDALGAAASALAMRSPPRRGLVRGAIAVIAAVWLATTVINAREIPGTGPTEDRAAQILVGNALRADGAEHVTLTPCAYEHFAVIAAYGAPERVTTEPSTGAAVSPSCPAVERR